VKSFVLTKTVGRVGAAVLLSAASVFVIAHAAIGSGANNSDPNFSISSTISSSSNSQIATRLFPGVQDYLWYTVHNPQQVPITVNSLGISSVTAPTGCPIANLKFDATTFNGVLDVPALSIATAAVPISLIDTGTDQDSCEGTNFTFTYSGSATFTEVYSTSTDVTSFPASPSGVGQSVTYTATVTASAASGQDPVPNGPTGSVTFMDDGSAILYCTNVSVSEVTVTTAQASCTTFAYSAPGTHLISAKFTNSDGNFVGSTSSMHSQVVS
jgi:hypothetical protein